jgi:hypothetical protein
MVIASRAPRATPVFMHELCSNLVHQLRILGYPHADHTTCERMLRAYFPYEPVLVEGSADAVAAEAFLSRFVDQCRQRAREATAMRNRRCYGQAIEEAMTEVASRGEWAGHAPRLTELMTQLDADGHNTTQLRIELEALVDEVAMGRFYKE